MSKLFYYFNFFRFFFSIFLCELLKILFPPLRLFLTTLIFHLTHLLPILDSFHPLQPKLFLAHLLLIIQNDILNLHVNPKGSALPNFFELNVRQKLDSSIFY
uniref:Uncharacterized protein n=1 Tax=Cacopsylla melanoneura TaxID=428564 RepID=A0A8D8MA44_9HEMI